MVKNALADYAAENFEVASYTALIQGAQELSLPETFCCDLASAVPRRATTRVPFPHPWPPPPLHRAVRLSCFPTFRRSPYYRSDDL